MSYVNPRELYSRCRIPAEGLTRRPKLRVALFSQPTPEHLRTLLQRHPDTIITATSETARYSIGEHPDWVL